MLRVRDRNDLAAFALLAGRWRAPLRRFFAALLAPPGPLAAADDLVQETLLRLWTTRAAYAPTGRFSSYLFQIGKHFWLNERAKALRRAPLLGGWADIEIVAPPATQPEAVLLERLRRDRISAAIALLPPRYHDVFTLSHLSGLKYAQIACQLGVPVGTVKSRMAEAVRRLRQTLSEEDEEQR